MKKGLLIVLSGPSGVGKKTVWSPLMKDSVYRLGFSISMTTRSKRFDEVHGKDYFFVTHEQFKDAITKGKMLEYATYVDNIYGTPKEYVDQLRNEGLNVLLEIEAQGALQIMDYAKKSHDKGVVTIFIAPPSIDELVARLRKRGTETHEKIEQRVKQAKWEMSVAHQYKYLIINDKLEHAQKELAKVLREEIIKNEQ